MVSITLTLEEIKNYKSTFLAWVILPTAITWEAKLTMTQIYVEMNKLRATNVEQSQLDTVRDAIREAKSDLSDTSDSPSFVSSCTRLSTTCQIKP